MLRTREEWQAAIKSGLPAENRFSERNRAITARYASWYLDHPDFFKWSGMAAYASRQVGIAIVSAEMMLAPERMGSANPFVWLHGVASGMFMVRDLVEIKSGNNRIFNDIAWAHAAYLEGGLDEVEGNAEGSDRGLLLEGFRMIDRGVKMPGSDEASHLVWQGNMALLRHEQTVVLQPVFDSLSPGGKLLASFGSELDFSGGYPSDPRCVASFSAHCGYIETLAGMKSIACSADRWEWVESRVIPAWMESDRLMREEPARKRDLQSMASVEPGMLHRLSDLTARFLPMS
jgi:hypothetical protein